MTFVANVTLLITCFFVLGTYTTQQRPKTNHLIPTVTLVVCGILLMYQALRLPNDILVDFRHIPIIFSALTLPPPITLLVAAAIITARYVLFGFTFSATISLLSLSLITLFGFYVHRQTWSVRDKWLLASAGSAIIVLSLAMIVIRDYFIVAQIAVYYIPLSLLAGLLAAMTMQHLQRFADTLNKVRYTKAQLRTLISSIQSAIVLESEDRKIQLVNDYFLHLFSVSTTYPHDADAFFRMLCLKVNDCERFDRRLRDIIERHEIVLDEVVYLTDGRILEFDFIPIVLEGKQSGYFWNYRDITKRKSAEKKLEELNFSLALQSRLDGLTGIPNRRAFDEYLADSVGSSHPFTLVMMDIDFFKAYNDHYGHLQGDHAIITVARLLKQYADEHHYFVARYGGEEFVLLIAAAEQPLIMEHLQQFQQALATIALSHEKSPFQQLTVSIGVSFYRNDAISGEALVHAADEALYEAKKSGRNKVIFGPLANEDER